MDYRKAKDAELRQMARFMMEKARVAGPQEMGPLNPYARRLVHLTVAEDPQMSSESIGDAFLKTVIISVRMTEGKQGSSARSIARRHVLPLRYDRRHCHARGPGRHRRHPDQRALGACVAPTLVTAASRCEPRHATLSISRRRRRDRSSGRDVLSRSPLLHRRGRR